MTDGQTDGQRRLQYPYAFLKKRKDNHIHFSFFPIRQVYTLTLSLLLATDKLTMQTVAIHIRMDRKYSW